MLFGGELPREETLARCLALVVVAIAAGGGGCLLPPLDLTGKSCVAQDDCGELVCVDNRCAAAGDRELRDGGASGVDASAPRDGSVPLDGGQDGGVDAAVLDEGGIDAATLDDAGGSGDGGSDLDGDAGSDGGGPLDSGPYDAGPGAADAGPADASVDAGSADGGSGDAGVPVDWWDTAFRARVRIGFATAPLGGDLVDFPVVVRLTSARVDLSRMRPDLADLRFIAQDGLAALPYEIEHASADEVVVWVRLPFIRADGSTTFSLYFDHPGAAAGAAPSEVWDETFLGVWHLDESSGDGGPASQYDDSTSAARHGVASVTATGKAGAAGPGQEFDGVDDLIDFGNLPAWNLAATDYTLEAMFRAPDPQPDDFSYMLSREVGGIPGAGYHVGVSYLEGQARGENRAELVDGGSNVLRAISPAGYLDNEWHHLAFTVDNDARVGRLYIDGVEVDSDVWDGSLLDHTGAPLTAGGKDSSSSTDFYGSLDELRVSNAVRSEAWLKAHVAAMADQLLVFEAAESL